ncbi:hypothetical protein ACB092_06G225000 [Castanea dentata]
MSFKDLTMFNEAVFAKLSWQLLHDDNSLFFRVFKARFFPNGSILDAKESASPSYAWKGILIGRDVILKGALWRPKVISPIIFEPQNSSVEVLINQSNCRWRSEVIDHCFNLAEAKMIKNIPLSSTSQPDKLIWPFTPTGQYSVKSGYRFLFEGNNAQPPSSPSSSQEALPTKANLNRQKIVPDGVCDRCKRHSEDNSHALFFCSDVQVVWASDPQWQWLLAMQGQTAKEIFKRALEEDRNATLLAFTSWAIWNRRNQIRTGQTAWPLNQIPNTSKERKIEFQLLHPSNPKQQHKKHTRWKPPAEDNLKVNYDGAIFQEQGRACIGVVIRNSAGGVMASLSQQIPLPTTVAQVEAMAARRAVEFAPSLALHGLLIRDAQDLAISFTSINFSHVCRQGNIVAHNLARRQF